MFLLTNPEPPPPPAESPGLPPPTPPDPCSTPGGAWGGVRGWGPHPKGAPIPPQPLVWCCWRGSGTPRRHRIWGAAGTSLGWGGERGGQICLSVQPPCPASPPVSRLPNEEQEPGRPWKMLFIGPQSPSVGSKARGGGGGGGGRGHPPRGRLGLREPEPPLAPPLKVGKDELESEGQCGGAGGVPIPAAPQRGWGGWGGGGGGEGGGSSSRPLPTLCV